MFKQEIPACQRRILSVGWLSETIVFVLGFLIEEYSIEIRVMAAVSFEIRVMAIKQLVG